MMTIKRYDSRVDLYLNGILYGSLEFHDFKMLLESFEKNLSANDSCTVCNFESRDVYIIS